MHIVAVHGEANPHRTVMAKDQLQIRRLAENAHVGEHAMIHEVVRANTIAAKLFAHKFVAPLCFFDFSDHRCNQKIAFQLHSRAFKRFHGLRVANQSALHVVDAKAVDQSVLDDGFCFVSDSRQKPFAASIGRIHVTVEHQAFPVACSFPQANNIGAALLDFLPRNRESRFFECASHVAPHFKFFARGAGNIDNVAAHGDEFVFANLRKNGVGQILVHCIRFPSC